jgi:hypothetical protein
MRSDVEQLFRRADSLYSTKEQPQHPGIFVVEPSIAAKPTELEQARALVVAFLKELPELMLLVAALAVVGIRRCWLWLRQRRRTPQVG